MRHDQNGTKPILIALSLILALILPPPAEAERAKPVVSVLIAYHSVGGHTRSMAEAVQTGAQSVKGVDVILRSVADATNEEVLAADAIIIGSPVYNANVAPEVQMFINSWPFEGAPLKNRLGAAFVSAGGISAGEETTQLSILRSMLIYGMIVVGGPDWKQAFGASGIVSEKPFRSGKGTVNEQFLTKAEALGRRVAELALEWSRDADPSGGVDD
ncbi:MAG: flavodoxin family protein [Alphaproteobacteria bacterium]|nr:flavodoxin family protein [Alphaproteobacteria bacterium]